MQGLQPRRQLCPRVLAVDGNDMAGGWREDTLYPVSTSVLEPGRDHPSANPTPRIVHKRRPKGGPGKLRESSLFGWAKQEDHLETARTDFGLQSGHAPKAVIECSVDLSPRTPSKYAKVPTESDSVTTSMWAYPHCVARISLIPQW